MQQVEWRETHQTEPRVNDSLPFATHSGELELFGHTLRVYRLNTGEAIVHADDLHELFSGAERLRGIPQ
jgi:hypothetical protein